MWSPVLKKFMEPAHRIKVKGKMKNIGKVLAI